MILFVNTRLSGADGVKISSSPGMNAKLKQQDWSMSTIPELVANIVSEHHVPLRLELERLGIIIDRFAVVHLNAAVSELRKLYHDLKNHLLPHLDKQK